MPKQKRKRPQDLNGSKLKAGQQRATPGQIVVATHVPETVAPTHRHPDLQPVTLTALIDAFKLNEIPFSYTVLDQYGYALSTASMTREINPFDGAEVLQFFKDVINFIPQPR